MKSSAILTVSGKRQCVILVVCALFLLPGLLKAQDSTRNFNDGFLKTPITLQFPAARHRTNPVRPYIIPAAFVSYGFLSLGKNSIGRLNLGTQKELQEDHPGFKTSIDNYLQYSPAAAVYALNALGIKGEHNLRDRTIIYGMSVVISSVVVQSLKTITKIDRPDHSANNSFPSGHTATAFAAAAFMEQEYRHVSTWYGVAGYAAATATGILRLYNNKHWLGDVVAGAGFGILSTKLSYLVYPAIKKKFFKNKPVAAMLLPYYQNHNAGLCMVYHFKK